MKGTVKWFDPVKGYGFIMSDDDHELFFHKTGIALAGYRKFEPGDRVIFDIGPVRKGTGATNVKPFIQASEPRLAHRID